MLAREFSRFLFCGKFTAVFSAGRKSDLGLNTFLKV